MNHFVRKLAFCCLFSAVAATSCSDAKSSAEEEQKIKHMDSVSSAIKDSTDRLKDVTERVEASLDKLNEEFKSTEQQKK